MTHDDCSIAFLAFGYEAKDFNSFKSTFIKRYKSVDEAFNRYYRDKKYIPYALGEEENPEEYIYDRADSRREEIARKIAVELINNPQTAESVVTPKIKSFFDTLIEKTKVSRATEKLTKEKEKSEELEKLLLDDYSKDYTLVKKLFEIDESGEGVDLKTVIDLKDLLVTVDLLLQKYEDISVFEKESESKIPSCDKIDQSRDELIQKIIARIDEIAIATEMYERLLENAKEEKEWNKENSVSPDFTSMIDRIIKHYELGVTVSKNEIVALNKLIEEV